MLFRSQLYAWCARQHKFVVADGVLYHKLMLTRAPGVELPKVVSEGEQRCLSIAAFFAELSTADDPSDLPEGAGWPINDPRFRFMNAAVAIVLRIYHRPEWVALEQRQPKSWLPISASEWRMFEKEKPPPGVPVMLMGATGPVVGVEQLPSKLSGTE